MSDRRDPSPGARREGPKRGATHPRMRGEQAARRGRSPEALAARNRRALAALDRWQLQYAETPADPLDSIALYADWIRAEIRLVRKLWGKEEPAFIGQLNDTMHGWALQIDQQIRELLEKS